MQLSHNQHYVRHINYYRDYLVPILLKEEGQLAPL